MDPNQAQPTEAQPADAADAAASDSPQEQESSFFNSMIRGLAGVFRGERDDRASEPAEEQPSDATQQSDQATTPQPVDPTQTPEFRAAVQSAKDRELTRERREWAKSRADEGDLTPIRQLAERGDGWAQRQLAENGDTWALGEIKQRELREQQARENDPLPILAQGFDQSVLHPILGALPEEDERRIVSQGLVGLDGRKQAVDQAITALKKHAAEEAVVKALDDPQFVSKLLKSEAFRVALRENPVANGQTRAFFRGELDEPDLAPGSGPGRGGQRESDVMNQMIRDLAQGAEVRGPRERAAGAGARNGRAVNLDVLDDDD